MRMRSCPSSMGCSLPFHNRVIRDNDGISFGEAQDWGRWRYQYVVLNDLLPRIFTS
jgi:hypothetical protein